MHISKIELENIKSHAASTFEFTRGTTAITGENGAGKTTIIEAIAWVLFDLLDYKKEDFIKRGEKKGVVKVTFESGLDEREYIVTRDTGAGYNVTDPRLQTRIADKKEEVFRFLWQHLGLEPGTDLKSLFKQAIGVPQGTFTAIFLEGATERKIAFDRLLKVEEYRQAAEKLRETSKYLDMSVAAIREGIARAEGELTRSDTVKEEYKTYQQQAKSLASEVETLERSIVEKRHVVGKLDELERVENAIANIKADQKRLQKSIEAVQKAHAEITKLKPKVAEQERLEGELHALREKIADAKAVENQIKSLDERIERLRTSYRANAEQLKEAEAKAAGAGEIKSLESRDAQLVREIATLKASLERDQKFQGEIQNGLCPILSQKCLNLKAGETLESFISSQFTDLRSQIVGFETEQISVAANLKTAREAERFAAMLKGFRDREAELTAEGTHFAAERKELEMRIGGLVELEKSFAAIENNIKTLGDPRSRIRFLENETAREAELRENVTKIESNLERLETDRRILSEDLDEHQDLIAGGYNNVRHVAERTALHETEKRHAEIRATFDAAKRREVQLCRVTTFC